MLYSPPYCFMLCVKTLWLHYMSDMHTNSIFIFRSTRDPYSSARHCTVRRDPGDRSPLQRRSNTRMYRPNGAAMQHWAHLQNRGQGTGAYQHRLYLQPTSRGPGNHWGRAGESAAGVALACWIRAGWTGVLGTVRIMSLPRLE